MTSGTSPPRPFGRVLTAMVTAVPRRRVGRPRGHRPGRGAPRRPRQRRRRRLRHDGGVADHDAPRRTARILRAVVEAVGDRATVVAGRRHQQHRALGRARRAGREGRRRRRAARDAVLQQAHARTGVLAHFRAVADASGLPVMLYDIPGRTGITIADDTYRAVAEHDRIVAVKDAVGDLYRGVRLMAETGLAFYSGDDVLNLGWLTHGGCGVVSVVGHVAGERVRRDGRRRRPRRPRPRPSAIYRRLAAGRRVDHDPRPGRDDREGGAAAPRRARQPHRPAPARARRRRRSSPSSAPCSTGRTPDLLAKEHLHEPPAPRALRPGPAAGERPAGHPARRARRGRSQHDRLRVRRPAADRRLRRAVPRGPPPRRRPDPARLRPDPGPARRRRGAGAHPRPRGPHRRDAVPPPRAAATSRWSARS